MSTRSIIAIAGESPTEWKGRYCHSDGYPSWNGRVIWNEVVAAGPKALYEFLDGEGSHDISTISEGFLTDPKPESWTSATGGGSGDGNYRVYSNRPGEKLAAWRTSADEGREEWLYVIDPVAMHIYDTHDHDKLVATCPFDGSEPDWSAIEEAAYAS